MARTCIYTLEPLEHGGVMAKVRFVDELLHRFGHSTNLLFTATEQVPVSSRIDKVRYFLRHPYPYWTNVDGLRGLAFPHWPLPLWMTYSLPWLFGRAAYADRAIHVVVSGANHCGLPAALARKRYIIWIGTLYRDELEGKALVGDKWAQRLLTGLSGRVLQAQEQKIFDRAALVLTNGAHTAGRIREVYPHIADKVRVAIYPVDTSVFKPDPEARSKSRRYLLFTARINDVRKNLGMLFQAYARVRVEFPELRLVLTGDLPDDNVRRQLDTAGVGEYVDFVGRLPVPKLVRLYQGAELFALSSTQEGLGISMLEALACGVPVVATRCGGPESVIVDGKTGFLVPVGDDRAMADCICQLLADEHRLREMRGTCTAHAQRAFSRTAVERVLLGAFQSVYPEQFTSSSEGA